MNLDPELQKEFMKDGQVQREKIPDNVEKLLEASNKGYLFTSPLMCKIYFDFSAKLLKLPKF